MCSFMGVYLKATWRISVIGAELRRGEGNGMAKLTSDKVRDIRRQRAAKVPRKVLAKRFQVGLYTIRDIDRGFTWGWLE